MTGKNPREWKRNRLPLIFRLFCEYKAKQAIQIVYTQLVLVNFDKGIIYVSNQEIGFPFLDCSRPRVRYEDIHTGRMFSDVLEEKGIDPKQFPYYEHELVVNKRSSVRARLNPFEYLVDFRQYFNEEWLPQKLPS